MAPLRPGDSPSPPRHAVETRVPACSRCPPLRTLLVRLSVVPTLTLGRVFQITAFCSPPGAVFNYSPAPAGSQDSHLRPRPRAGTAGHASWGKQFLLGGGPRSRLEEALSDKCWRRGRNALLKERPRINPERICITAAQGGLPALEVTKPRKSPSCPGPVAGLGGMGKWEGSC